MNKTIEWWEWAVCMAVIVCLGLLFGPPLLSRAGGDAHRASCQYNMKQMWQAFRMYASESPGERYPPRSPIPGNWTVDPHSLYPEYLADLGHFICPGSPRATPETFRLRRNFEHPGTQPGEMHPDCVSSEFYIYLGHAVSHDDTALRLYEASLETPPELLTTLDVSVHVPGFDALDSYRGGLPIMWDRIPESGSDFPHGQRGINVLHMSGHVTFVEYDPYNGPGNFPATYISAKTFCRDRPRLSVDCY